MGRLTAGATAGERTQRQRRLRSQPAPLRRSARPQSSTLDVGRDVQQAASAGAEVANAPHAAVVALGTIGTRPGALAHLIRRLPSNRPPLVWVAAAGPWGSGLSRERTPKGPGCGVVAPALIPHKPGARVTTHRRAAIQRARLRRAGALTPVDVPTVAEAAMRALGRARAAALRALQTAQVRLKASLRRPARRDTGRAASRRLGPPLPAGP